MRRRIPPFWRPCRKRLVKISKISTFFKNHEAIPSIEVFHAEKENRTKMSQGPQPFHLPYDHAAARLVKNYIFHVLCWILKANIVQIKWQSDCLNKEKSGEIQWIMKRCVRLAFLLTTCEEDSHQYCHIQFHHHPKGRDMFLWLTFFSLRSVLFKMYPFSIFDAFYEKAHISKGASV